MRSWELLGMLDIYENRHESQWLKHNTKISEVGIEYYTM